MPNLPQALLSSKNNNITGTLSPIVVNAAVFSQIVAPLGSHACFIRNATSMRASFLHPKLAAGIRSPGWFELSGISTLTVTVPGLPFCPWTDRHQLHLASYFNQPLQCALQISVKTKVFFWLPNKYDTWCSTSGTVPLILTLYRSDTYLPNRWYCICESSKYHVMVCTVLCCILSMHVCRMHVVLYQSSES